MGLTRVVVDAGVWIATLDDTDIHHEPATTALAQLVNDSTQIVVPVSVYAEILVGPSRRGPDAIDVVDQLLARVNAELVDITPAIARAAAALRAAHPGKLRLPDAFVVATALDTAARQLVTTDDRWPRTDDLDSESSLVVNVIGAD